MQTKTSTIANTDSTRPNQLAPLILGLGAAVAIALATPTLAAERHDSIKPTKEVKVVLGTESIEEAVPMPKRKPQPQPEAKAEKALASLLPPDPCAAGPKEYDCNQNGINDICDITDGWADANEDGILDSCQLAAGDLNLDGTVDSVDLVLILNDWGTEGSDANSDGVTNAIDLAAVLSNWSTKG